ncbi:MAG TPA: hypothetical protein VGC04_13515 [Cellulomonas sp.]
MGAFPRSLLTALRDLTLLAVAALFLGGALDAALVGRPVAAVVVGLPAVGAATATVLVYLTLARSAWPVGAHATGDVLSELVPQVLPAVVAPSPRVPPNLPGGG